MSVCTRSSRPFWGPNFGGATAGPAGTGTSPGATAIYIAGSADATAAAPTAAIAVAGADADVPERADAAALSVSICWNSQFHWCPSRRPTQQFAGVHALIMPMLRDMLLLLLCALLPARVPQQQCSPHIGLGQRSPEVAIFAASWVPTALAAEPPVRVDPPARLSI